MIKKECPRCENNLIKAVVVKTNEPVLICDDCEGLWLESEKSLTGLNDLRLRAYLESNGLQPTWDSVRIIEDPEDL